MKKVIAMLVVLVFANRVSAQDSASLKQHLNMLCSKSFAGRGYVAGGMKKAAVYIAQQFQADSLQAFGKDYRQPFSYSVNTFPSVVDVKIGDRTLKPGVDFLVHAAAKGFNGENLKVKVIDGSTLSAKLRKRNADTLKVWAKWSKQFSKPRYAYVLLHTDSINTSMQWKSNRDLVKKLPAGVFFIPYKKKPIWTVSQTEMPATVIELYDSALVLNSKTKVSVAIDNKFIEKFDADNVCGSVKGTEQPDTFIVITAHYDHLGKMGNRTMFPGGSDNGSGTAMLLELARYYSAHPAKYTMVFIAFAGEEAGLLGSKYFTEHPLIPLSNIKFLVNVDIMGDATDGISVVNGKAMPEEFARLDSLNKIGIDGFHFKEVKQGGPAANSDHYFFTEKGVPAFFIFSMGGKGYYHDIWDKAENVQLTNIPKVGTLLERFIETF